MRRAAIAGLCPVFEGERTGKPRTPGWRSAPHLEDIEGAPAGSTELKACLDTCLSLSPDEDLADDDLCLLGYFAEDAVAAVSYAIETRQLTP
jgi:hypothetical protein